jgi:hypothetical protein
MAQPMPGEWYGPAARAQRRWVENRYRYLARADREAAALGDTHCGPEHLLLALVAPTETTLAARALRECRARYDALLEVALRDRPKRTAQRSWRTQPPVMYAIGGRADGLAAALGAKRVEPEHLLLALLREPDGYLLTLLKQVGASPDAVQRRLARLGAAVPPRRPPREDDTRYGETITLRIGENDAWALASLVHSQLSEGAPFDFNFNTTSVWFTSGEGIELGPIVRRARRRQLAERRRYGDLEPDPPDD